MTAGSTWPPHWATSQVEWDAGPRGRVCPGVTFPSPSCWLVGPMDVWSPGSWLHRQQQGPQCLAYTWQRRAISFLLELILPPWGSEMAHPLSLAGRLCSLESRADCTTGPVRLSKPMPVPLGTGVGRFGHPFIRSKDSEHGLCATHLTKPTDPGLEGQRAGLPLGTKSSPALAFPFWGTAGQCRQR